MRVAGFASAVLASCGIAVGMNQLSKMPRWSPTTRMLLSRVRTTVTVQCVRRFGGLTGRMIGWVRVVSFVQLGPFVAVCAANAVNIGAIRYPELAYVPTHTHTSLSSSPLLWCAAGAACGR